MRYLLFIILFLPSMLFAQSIPWGTPNPRDIVLGFQTTGDGLTFRGAGQPTFVPNNNQYPYVYVDTVGGDKYLFVKGTWLRTTTKYSALPPKPNKGIIGDSTALWVSTVDSNMYSYSNKLSAWTPSTGIFFGNMIPSDKTATDTTGAVTYIRSFWHNTATDSMMVYAGGIWKNIGSVSTGGDDWGSQVVITASTLTGNGTAGSPLAISPSNTRAVLVVGTYKNDSDAQTNGVTNGEWYILKLDNTLGLSPGTLRVKTF
jgi:hypothetical protein